MKRIVSKIDYNMQKLCSINPILANEFWKIIKDKNFVLNYATKIIEDENTKSKCFASPAICHMILSNPKDVPEDLYKNLVISIIKNSDLNKLTVFGNESFLYLCMANNPIDLDPYFDKCIVKELNARTSTKLRQVEYNTVLDDSDAVLSLQDEKLNITLGSNEAEIFENDKQFSISNKDIFDEIELMRELAVSSDDMSQIVKTTIMSMNIYRRKAEEPTEVIQLKRIKAAKLSNNRLVL